jgi:hypothetical protein
MRRTVHGSLCDKVSQDADGEDSTRKIRFFLASFRSRLDFRFREEC